MERNGVFSLNFYFFNYKNYVRQCESTVHVVIMEITIPITVQGHTSKKGDCSVPFIPKETFSVTMSDDYSCRYPGVTVGKVGVR